MAYPMGEAKLAPLRVDFDRRLKLEFHGSDISSDGGEDFDNLIYAGKGTRQWAKIPRFSRVHR